MMGPSRLFLALLIAAGALAGTPAHAATGPVVTVVAPGSYFPVHDGYEDVFPVTISTDEEATAHLYLLNTGGSIVARGVKALDEDRPTTVTAGAGLRPGTYRWFLAITDLAGNTTTTATKTVIADGRRLLATTVTKSLPVSGLAATLRQGACSHVDRTKAGLVLSSDLTCASSSPAADTASASITFPLAAGVSYGKITLSTRSVGNNGVITAYQGATQQVAQSGPLPTTTFMVSGDAVTKAHTLRFAVETSSGERLTLQAVTVRYVVSTLR